MSAVDDALDLRCDANPGRLFARLKAEGGRPVFVDGMLIEFSCRDCRTSLRRQGQDVLHVLHRFNAMGVLVETEVVPVGADNTEESGRKELET